jgi:tight adherence protein B
MILLLFPVDIKPFLKSKFKRTATTKSKEKWEEIKPKNKNRIEKLNKKIEDTLIQGGFKIKISEFYLISLITGVIGLFIGKMLNNFLVSLLLFGVFAYLPYKYFSIIANSYKNLINKYLENAISIIIAAFQSREDLILAIEDNINNFQEPLKSYFIEFVNKVDKFGMSFDESIDELAAKIGHPIFDDFVKLAKIHYQKGGDTKYALLDIPEDFRDHKLIMSEIDAEISSIKILGYIFSGLVIGAIFFQRMTNYNYYSLLVNTTAGKITVFISLVIFLFTIRQIKKIDNQIKV